MLNEVCAYLNNYFDVNADHVALPSWRGEFVVSNGILDLGEKITDGQYFRIQNSIFNDGVHEYPAINLHDETFTGKIQAMAVPSDLIAIVGEITAWMDKYGGADSTANSPYNSESFGGYSYSKSPGGASIEGSGMPAWWGTFGGRLARWRKL